jgi:hypothetical protein
MAKKRQPYWIIGAIILCVIVAVILVAETDFYAQPKNGVFEGIVFIPTTQVLPSFEGENCGTRTMLVDLDTNLPSFEWDDGYWLMGMCKLNNSVDFFEKEVVVTGTVGIREGTYPIAKCVGEDCPPPAKRDFKVIDVKEIRLR